MLTGVSVRLDTLKGSEEVVVVPLNSGTRKLTGAAARLDKSTRGAIGDAIRRGRFGGKRGEMFLITLRQTGQPANLLLLGMGERSDADADNIADAAGASARVLGGHKFRSAWLLFPDEHGDDPTAWAHAFVKGFALALYGYRMAKAARKPSTLKRLTILSGDHRKEIGAAARRALIVAEQTEAVRDFVNAPAAELTPTIFAKQARAMCRENGVSCRVLGEKDLEKEKMGAMLAVGRGSVEPSRLIVMHYNKGKRGVPRVCLVGKGVTFDSGGISIKPWNGMWEMKGDMAGAGVVVSSINAAARLGLPLEIVAIAPCVENMPDGRAVKPGDVVTTAEGSTIEVLSTDAEGRLILVDAITYARKHFKPDVLVDYATLTGAVLIALGKRIAGVMGNSQEHVDALVEAGRDAGEPVWQLPLDNRNYEAVKGDISDYKNYAGRDASTITAAALLGSFAGKTPWAHLDIAGTFWNDGSGPRYQPKGATGYGVDLTLRFLERLAK